MKKQCLNDGEALQPRSAKSIRVTTVVVSAGVGVGISSFIQPEISCNQSKIAALQARIMQLKAGCQEEF